MGTHNPNESCYLDQVFELIGTHTVVQAIKKNDGQSSPRSPPLRSPLAPAVDLRTTRPLAVQACWAKRPRSNR